MKKSNLQEQLVGLYLRLNGYFVSGFIAHAPLEHGRQSNLTEVDVLAVRFPHHSEPEREVGPSDYLQVPLDRIDILICEVKGGRKAVQFNEPLRNRESVEKALRWVGAFNKTQVDSLIGPVIDSLSPREIDSPTEFRCVQSPDSPFQIRCILFAPDRPAPRANQVRYVHRQELVDYIWKCLRPDSPRAGCATQYNFELWGNYAPLVRCFKNASNKDAIKQAYETIFGD